MENEKLNRREFAILSAKVVLSGSLLTLLLEGCGDAIVNAPAETEEPLAKIAATTFAMDLNAAQYAALKKVGGAVRVTVNGAKLIVTRVSASSYAAFSSTCTHAGCQVSLPNASGVIVCPCHGSKFDSSGKLLRGPARRDLPKAAVAQAGKTLKVTA